VMQPALAEGVVVRRVGEFVGRRREEREGRRALTRTKAGLVVHGIGGVGKSTLAAELIRSVGLEMVVASKAGPLGVDTLLDEVGLRLGQAARDSGMDDTLLRAAHDLRRSEVAWDERWQLLTAILATVPLLVLLDNFEDNLTFAGDAWTVRDVEVGDLLARWARHPGRSRLLITSRHPFTMAHDAHRRLATMHLGPLSPAETTKLVWQLPGLDGLTFDERERAYRDVGGHPRTLEYLDALLRGGEARFEDVAERMERQLTKRGIVDPQAWLRSPTRGVDAALAEAVTLAVDDVVLGELLDQLSLTPLARELVVGASVYRHPVNDTALAWQIASEIEPEHDSDREARMQRVTAFHQAALDRGDGQPSLESLGLSSAELNQYQADVATQLRPPLQVPAAASPATAAAASAGLLSPVTRGAQPQMWFVHRWTARAIAALEPATTRASHTKAARHWHWRVDHVPQSPEQDIEQLVEARFHHHAAGDTDTAVSLTNPIVAQLRTWGHYGRAAELCRQTLGWVDDGSSEAGRMHGEIAQLAYLRGDLTLAERSYTHAIRILEQSGDELAAAATYANLGILRKDRGDYAAAETAYVRAIAIQKPAGDGHNVAANYGNLGTLAQLRGDYDAAEARYRESLEIRERLGDQSGMATSCSNLANLHIARDELQPAVALHIRSLA
ncbi:MAG: tetratricopeptide repeat protein, partial [Actinobacteria bacterium]|nr:tetratricopeptide repeat protein [Actinomycetota bacterium]